MRCPTHGVVVEGVPFARPRAKLTRDFDDLLAWLATKMDKTSTARLCRVSWRTVGGACEPHLHDLRRHHEPGRQSLRLPELRLHQRLQLSPPPSQCRPSVQTVNSVASPMY
ncbi:MAG: transposase family protein [Acidimicrobiales bacterium]